MAKIDDYDFRRVEQEVIDFKDDVTFLLNQGKYGAQVVDTVPTWVARNGEFLFFRDSNTTRIYFYVNNAWQFIDTESPRSWINFDGSDSPAIAQSYNVDTLTRNDVGEYEIKFLTNVANANIVINGTARSNNNDPLIIAPISAAVSSYLIRTYNVNQVLSDAKVCTVTIFGD